MGLSYQSFKFQRLTPRSRHLRTTKKRAHLSGELFSQTESYSNSPAQSHAQKMIEEWLTGKNGKVSKNHLQSPKSKKKWQCPDFREHVREGTFRVGITPSWGALSESLIFSASSGGGPSLWIATRPEKSSPTFNFWISDNAYYPKSVKFRLWGPEEVYKKSSEGF